MPMKKQSATLAAEATVSPKVIEVWQTNIDALFNLQYLMCTHMKQPDQLAGDLEQMEIHLRALTGELPVPEKIG
jgi:hypothetical protein